MPVIDREKEKQLWMEYKRNRKTALPKLYEIYFPLLEIAASRILERDKHYDFGDYLAWGFVGLVRAIERFDPKRGYRFCTFAPLRIRGAIIDGLRSINQVPRTAVQRNAMILRAEEAYCCRNGIVPDDVELSTLTGLPEKAVRQDRRLSITNNLSSFAVDGDKRAIFACETRPLEIDSVNEFESIIENLAETEKRIIRERLVGDLDFNEIDRYLKIRNSRKLYAKAIQKLKDEFGVDLSSINRSATGRSANALGEIDGKTESENRLADNYVLDVVSLT